MELSEQFEFKNHNGGKDLLFLACYFIFIQCSVASAKASWRLCGRWSSCEPSSGFQGQGLEKALPWRSTFYEEPPMTAYLPRPPYDLMPHIWIHPQGTLSLMSVHTIVHAGKQTHRGSHFLQLGIS